MFNEFPYTNFHELNTDWLIAMCKKIMSELDGIETKAQEAVNKARGAQYVVFPPLESVNNWTLYRNLDDTSTGIEFTKEAPYAKIIHNNARYPILSTANPPDKQMINDLQIDQLLVARSTVDYDTTYRPQEETLFAQGIRAILIPNDQDQYDQMHLLYKKTNAGVSYVDSISFTQTGEGVGVISIAGKTGVLTLSDIGACPAINDEAATSSAPWSGERVYQTIQDAIDEALEGSTISSITDSITALTGSLDTLEDTLDAYGSRIDDLEVDVADLKTGAATTANTLTSINASINTINSSITSLESGVSTNTGAIADNLTAIQDLEDRVGDIEDLMPDTTQDQLVIWSTAFQDAIPVTLNPGATGNVVIKLNRIPDGYTIVGSPMYVMWLGNTNNPITIPSMVFPLALSGGMNSGGTLDGIPTFNITVYNMNSSNTTCWGRATFTLQYTGRDKTLHPNPWPDVYTAPNP